MQDDNILVVSVIGPQSSGKSLLLNTLFGTQFLSSAGRCTRGIYGCLIDIKIMRNGTNYNKILILDTEGIQSTEAPDEGFDRRVVFYVLCVSHIVLICNKQEMNKNMEDIIKLASDCFLKARENIDMQPQVNLVMNNVHINESTLYNTIQNL
jgi:GTPase Era involved in 16S rRNA processing